jgi:hypothetical protein
VGLRLRHLSEGYSPLWQAWIQASRATVSPRTDEQLNSAKAGLILNHVASGMSGGIQSIIGVISMFKKIALSLVVLLIVGVAAAYFVRNMLVERAVEAGSEYALGVETNLGSAGLELGGGSLNLNNLEVSNPDGFTADHILTLRRGFFDVDAGSVLDDEVVVDSFIIEGVTLNLEQIDNKGNFKVLLDNIKRLDLSSSEESQKFRIGLIALRDINVSGSLSLMGKKMEKSYKLDDFSIRDVGRDNGAKVSEVTAKVVNTLITKALASGSGVLPAGFGQNLGDLKDKGMDELKTEAADKLKELGGSLTGENK